MKAATWGNISAWDLWQCLLLRTDCHTPAPVASLSDPSLFIQLEELMMKAAALESSHLQNRSETPTPNWAPRLKQSTLEQQAKVGNYQTGLKVNTLILWGKGGWWTRLKIILLHLRITCMFPYLYNGANTGILDLSCLNVGPTIQVFWIVLPLILAQNCTPYMVLDAYWRMNLIYSKWRGKEIVVRM